MDEFLGISGELPGSVFACVKIAKGENKDFSQDSQWIL